MTDYDRSLDQRLQIFERLKHTARAVTLPLYGAGMHVQNKATTGYDPVTNADISAEKSLRQIISDTFPYDHITGEEFPDIHGTNDWLWTLDPIDGTRAFVAGVPVWSTLIALSFRNQPVIGLIDHPALDHTLLGTPRGTTFQSGDTPPQNIQAAPCESLSNAILGCTEPLAIFSPGQLAAYNVIRRGVRFSRLGLDAMGYSLVARGRMDIIIEASLKPCDVRALMPVIEGAGGKMTNWHGGSCVDGGAVVAVGDPQLLPELYTYLGRAMDH